jgi:microcystin-dependent protein
MGQPFVGEVRPWGCNFAPFQWAFCAGQILPIQQYTALFSLLGTFYGGNGTSNFGLPDLRSRVPMKYGTSPAGSYSLGEQGGTEFVQILSQQMPVHSHTFAGTSAEGGHTQPQNGSSFGAVQHSANYYGTATSAVTPINPGTVSLYSGGNQPHTNIQPYQAINWCIALSGIYPSRN